MDRVVSNDMQLQMEWHNLLCPVVSMLKFRLPWYDGQTYYLAGEVYLPVWGRQTTTETRLIVRGHDMAYYDNKRYEEQMAAFNRERRVYYYDHGYANKRIIGIDHCYDCAAELGILEAYLISRGVLSIQLHDYVCTLSLGMNKACSTNAYNPRSLYMQTVQ